MRVDGRSPQINKAEQHPKRYRSPLYIIEKQSQGHQLFPRRAASYGKPVPNISQTTNPNKPHTSQLTPQTRLSRDTDSIPNRPTSPKTRYGQEGKYYSQDKNKSEEEKPLSYKIDLNVPLESPKDKIDSPNRKQNSTQIDQLIQKSMGDYNIKKMTQIGKGAFSKVYLAKQIISKGEKRLCALKVTDNYSKNPKSLQHISNEITLL